jgi:hypothetical protein
MARPVYQPPNDVALPLTSAPVAVHGPVLTYHAWLASLKVGDLVACYFDSNRMQTERVTSAPASFVSVGKYSKRVNFRRSDGCMCGTKPMSKRFRIERPT